MFVSDYLQLNEEQFDHFVEMGVFDALLDKDSNFFINVIRLKKSTIPEFVEAYAHLNKFFSEIATLLDAADEPTLKDKMYRTARNRFHFHEVNGINLGFSSTRWGAGWGQVTSDQFLRDAYQIVKKGSKQPEIFQLVSLFEENVAGDRLSDMIATIIEPEIKKYTLRVLSELGVNKDSNPDLMFRSDGLIQNPYKATPILLLPEEILHELPIAKDWDDIDRVACENETIRREISAEIGAEWTRWASVEKKNYLKQHVFMDPEVCDRVITGYKKEELDALDLRENPDYLAELLLKKIKKVLGFKSEKKNPSSFDAAMAVIGIFKDWVENNRGWAEIQNAPTKKREKAVQRFMHLGAKYYVDVNDLDISCEADEGRGPVDVKMSRGKDKTLAEIKLSSNSQYLHGYQEQVIEYAAAERTRSLIYVFIDVGNPGRLKTIKTLHRKNQIEGKACPELVIIDTIVHKGNEKMTIFSLKIFALICMVIDHIGAYIPDMPVQMRWIGRIAAPIYIFCLCEGIDHTSSEKKYLLRLYIGSLIMAVIQSAFTINANIFRTLLAIAVNLIMIKHIRSGEKEYQKYWLLYILWQMVTCTAFGWMYMRNQNVLIRRLYPALSGSIAFCEGGIPYIILGIVMYLTRNDKKKLALGFSLYCAVFAILNLTDLTAKLTDPLIAMADNPERMNRIIQYGFFTVFNAFRPGTTGKNPFMEQYQWMMIASLGFILMYNGQKGRSMKWFFYVFYVCHLLLLWYIGQNMSA